MAEKITTRNPTTEEELDSYRLMNEETAAEQVEACHEAFLEWRHVSAEERAKKVAAIGEELRNSKEEFAELMSKEVGKLIGDSRDEIDLCAAICDFTAEKGPEVLADEKRELAEGKRGIITYSPIGVVYGIQPWNFPAYQAVRYSVASLMAGNGVLLKHASNCTGSGVFLRKLYERAGLPKNLFSQLIIDHDVSDTVIEHDKVRGVTMTGSAEQGAEVAKKAGAVLKKSVMELGSNDAYVVLGDADMETAIEVCAQGRLVNNGETCIAAKRMVVVDSVYNEFVERYVEAMKSKQLGDPFDESTQLGPMARGDLRETLHEQVEKSISKGAKLLCGGEVPDRTGYFYPATVLGSVEPGQPAYDDELFGPVASVIRAKDDDDAMRIANDSRFGLGGGLISTDEDRAVKLAKEHFDTGMVFVNHYALASPNMPFGGVKNSGWGREHGGFGMREFVNAKSIFLP